MPKALTTASIVKCPHGFVIGLTSTATLTVAGSPVIRSLDLSAADFINCVDQVKCSSFVSFRTSMVLRDNSDPVVLDGGLATNVPPPCSVDAGHDILLPE